MNESQWQTIKKAAGVGLEFRNYDICQKFKKTTGEKFLRLLARRISMPIQNFSSGEHTMNNYSVEIIVPGAENLKSQNAELCCVGDDNFAN